MGNIKPSFIKNEGAYLLKEHGDEFGKDYAQNKKIVAKYVKSNKSILNKVAGYVTRKVRRKDKPQSKIYIQKAIEKRSKSSSSRRR
ncbi:30S ribosomal protein S17e [Candidatus Undinarchaeota archaeon]